MRRILPAFMFILSLAPLGLEAAPIVHGRSSIGFVSRQMGVPVTGDFKRFEADVEFFPNDVKKSRASITIHLDSIDAGSEEASTEIKRRPWLDVKDHPRAEFVSGSLVGLGNGRYRVTGRMTIKGITRDVSSDFTAGARQGFTVFEGKFVLNRLDFNVGEGVWSDIGTVSNEVEVTYVLTVPASKSR